MVEKIVNPETGLNDFIEFSDKFLYVEMENWRTVSEPNKDGKELIKFRADVWKFGEDKALMNVCPENPKLLSLTHVEFRKQINKIVEGKDPKTPLMIRAKTIGKEGNKLLYLVELV